MPYFKNKKSVSELRLRVQHEVFVFGVDICCHPSTLRGDPYQNKKQWIRIGGGRYPRECQRECPDAY